MAPRRTVSTTHSCDSLCVAVGASRQGGAQALIDCQQLESIEFSTREDVRGEVNRVQGAHRSATGDLTGHLTDAAADLPELATSPDRSDIPLGIGEPFFAGDTEGA